MIETPRSLLRFWTEEVTEPGWYKVDPVIDAQILQRFGALWHRVWLTEMAPWRQDLLACILLCDQFSRNMNRGLAAAFATDALARQMARQGIALGQDLQTPQPLRQFWYMPLTHSEAAADQAQAVALSRDRLDSAETLLHARAHQAVIAQFGRFPFRNAALNRKSTADEMRFMAEGGYPAIVRNLRANGAANPQPGGAASKDSLTLS